jgi:hypothetical protein
MELRIEITKQNRERIFEVINTLLEEEAAKSSADTSRKKASVARNYLSIPEKIDGLEHGAVMRYDDPRDKQVQLVGTWGQFNSFFPVKAALRILANFLSESEKDCVNLRNFIFQCIEVFRRTEIKNKRLGKYRGFPLRKKDTATGRFVWHFLAPAQEMGLIRVTKSPTGCKGIPTAPNDWNKVYITITQKGLEFARLRNPLFDGTSMEQVLGEDERKWIINFLKEVDEQGFGEYSLLKGVYEFLKEGHDGNEELWSWFERNGRFIDYVASWSRQAREPDQMKKQISRLAKTFSASKVALLRELAVVKNRRNDYKIIRGLEADELRWKR